MNEPRKVIAKSIELRGASQSFGGAITTTRSLPMSRFIALAAAFLLAGPALAQDANPTRYAVLVMEKPAGLQTTTVAADGLRNLSYEFNDRGRGPKLTARVRLDAGGVPSSVEIDGVDYLKAPVNERF